jgi:hypothetical protein
VRFKKQLFQNFPWRAMSSPSSTTLGQQSLAALISAVEQRFATATHAEISSAEDALERLELLCASQRRSLQRMERNGGDGKLDLSAATTLAAAGKGASSAVDSAVQVNTNDLRLASRPFKHKNLAGITQVEAEFDGLRQFMAKGAAPLTPAPSQLPAVPANSRPAAHEKRAVARAKTSGKLNRKDDSDPTPKETAERILSLIERLALSPRCTTPGTAPSSWHPPAMAPGSWHPNAGWQPRYAALRSPGEVRIAPQSGDTTIGSPKTVLAAVPRPLKAIIDRAALGAAEAEAQRKRGSIASEPKPHDFAAASGRAATAAAKHVDRLAPPFDFRN